ncbi:MAG: APA family basic amino acid/polyamine antiporter, partial [Gammaproteobacteria bacterium]
MQPPTPALKRQLGLALLVLYGLGNILGAGIYVLVGEVSAAAGYHAPLAFVVAAIVAALTAFSYGELAARYPVSAGVAIYMHKAFANKPLSITVGLLTAMAGLASTATLARGFVGYARIVLPVADSLLVTALVLALGLIAAWGIRQSVRIAAALTLVEVGGLLLV